MLSCVAVIGLVIIIFMTEYRGKRKEEEEAFPFHPFPTSNPFSLLSLSSPPPLSMLVDTYIMPGW
jgi:hypothetical protein